MRGETMKDKSKKSTYSTTFGIDPKSEPLSLMRLALRKMVGDVGFEPATFCV